MVGIQSKRIHSGQKTIKIGGEIAQVFSEIYGHCVGSEIRLIFLSSFAFPSGSAEVNVRILPVLMAEAYFDIFAYLFQIPTFTIPKGTSFDQMQTVILGVPKNCLTFDLM